MSDTGDGQELAEAFDDDVIDSDRGYVDDADRVQRDYPPESPSASRRTA